MIETKVIHNKDNKIVGIEVSGHANSGPIGLDLVCAGVSCIVTGGINALDDPGAFDIELTKGYSKIKPTFVNSDIIPHDRVVLEIIATQLKTIFESYPKYITIIDTCIE